MADPRPRLTLRDLGPQELLLLRDEVERRKKSPVTTWLLWLSLGTFGAHRFYLGRVVTGLLMLFTLGGIFIWAVIDLFLIPGMLRANKEKVQDEVLLELEARRGKAVS